LLGWKGVENWLKNKNQTKKKKEETVNYEALGKTSWKNLIVLLKA
jgi:hypothetical protein